MIKGQSITLQPATQDNKRTIFEWLIQWQTLAPNYRLPSWKEFCDDYKDFFFDGSQPMIGRCYFIITHNIPVGHISYHRSHPHYQHVELDIWMNSEENCGKGYGSDALITLCNHLFDNFDIKEFIIRPSSQNNRAIHAYEKAGFQQIKCSLEMQISKYSAPDSPDCIVMAKHLGIRK